MTISTADIQWLRQETGVGMMEAKKVLTAAHGDRAAAMTALREAGHKLAAAKSARTAKEGVIGSYVHPNRKVAAIVSLACETDFVARTDDLIELAHDLAIHVAAMAPRYLAPADVPAEVVAEEERIYREQLKSEGKPEKIWDKIVAGKIEKFYADNCLLKQSFVKDDTQTIEARVTVAVTKLGENIRINSFARLAV